MSIESGKVKKQTKEIGFEEDESDQHCRKLPKVWYEETEKYPLNLAVGSQTGKDGK